MTSATLLFTYLIGAIFAVGGVVFMVALDDNRFLFGIPYLLIGLVMLYGAYGMQKRARRGDRDEGGGRH